MVASNSDLCAASDCIASLTIFLSTSGLLALMLSYGAIMLIKRRRSLRQVVDLDKAMKRQQGVSSQQSEKRPSAATTETNGPTVPRKRLPWEIKYSEIKLQERIAYGTSGAVWKSQWMDMVVAVKIPHENISSQLKESFIDEAYMMSNLHHPNIVVFLGACLDMQNLALVLEFLERGSMHDFLKNENQKIDMAMLHHFATDIARGMKYLHQRCSIIQRDLKPRNLLIDAAYNVKICDFGLSKHMSKKEDGEDMEAAGTPYWTAPEVILGETVNRKADVFSFAIILWELVTREEPYSGLPGIEVAIKVAQEGLRPRIPKFCPDGYASLIQVCWEHDPKKRPNFSEVLERLLEIKKQAQESGLTKSNFRSGSPDPIGLPHVVRESSRSANEYSTKSVTPMHEISKDDSKTRLPEGTDNNPV